METFGTCCNKLIYIVPFLYTRSLYSHITQNMHKYHLYLGTKKSPGVRRRVKGLRKEVMTRKHLPRTVTSLCFFWTAGCCFSLQDYWSCWNISCVSLVCEFWLRHFLNLRYITQVHNYIYISKKFKWFYFPKSKHSQWSNLKPHEPDQTRQGCCKWITWRPFVSGRSIAPALK